MGGSTRLWEQLEERTGKGSKRQRTFQFWACRCDDKGTTAWICHQTDTQKQTYVTRARLYCRKEQFRDERSFYGTLFHEMGPFHGCRRCADHFQPTSFGSERVCLELVAELDAHVGRTTLRRMAYKEDSCAYLQREFGSMI